jgi:hypothetical protein
LDIVDMSDIVKYVSSALARGIHQNAFAASCDDTQMPVGPDRCPQLRKDLKKEPDPTAPLPAPRGGGEPGLGLGHGHGLDRGGSTGKTAR